ARRRIPQASDSGAPPAPEGAGWPPASPPFPERAARSPPHRRLPGPGQAIARSFRRSSHSPRQARPRFCQAAGENATESAMGEMRHFLRGQRIDPRPITSRTSVNELIDGAFLAYNGARLREAVQLFTERTLADDV